MGSGAEHCLYGWGISMLLVLEMALLPFVSSIAEDNAENHIIKDPPRGARIPCQGVEHVCASLMKVGGYTTFEEGTYCHCAEPEDLQWDEASPKALTWYHHERSDWMVQYRFCEDVMPQHVCRNAEEEAAIIRTEAEGWAPRIKDLRCRCKNNRYYMNGWNLDMNKYWDYHYTCDRPRCENKQPCVKHYIKETDKKTTTGYKFLCGCRDGYKCPTDSSRDIEKLSIDGTDNTGTFHFGYCIKHNQKNTENSGTAKSEDEER